MIEDRIHWKSILLTSKVMKMGTVLLIMIHILACCWYALGSSAAQGWTTYYRGGLSSEDESALYWYFASCRWTLAQINGQTDDAEQRTMHELAFTCVVSVTSAIVFMGVFVSSITTTMLELSKIAEGEASRRRLVKEYLGQHDFTGVLVGRVMKHLHDTDAQAKSNQLEREQQVMALLPKQLQHDLMYEQRVCTITRHSFFCNLHGDFHRAFHHLCHAAVQVLPVAKFEQVFEKGDACKRMVFVERGEVIYSKEPALAGVGQSTPPDDVLEDFAACPETLVLRKGIWLSEPALWMEWFNYGRLVGRVGGALLAVDAEQLARLLPNYRDACAMAVVYARWFLRELSKCKVDSDIIDGKVGGPRR